MTTTVADRPIPDRVAFRPLSREDLPLMLRWLADPDVAAWYDEGELTAENIAAKYTPLIDGEEPTRGFVILIDAAPAGYIQAYILSDHPDYQRQIDVDPAAVGIDLFLGAPERRNRGWGAVVLRAFLDRVVFGEMDAVLAAICPDPANARAVRSYQKVGFRSVKTVHVVDDEPGNTGDELVMLLRRDDVSSLRS
jgi:aminoglycoside 6'-N-acetyltransferase